MSTSVAVFRPSLLTAIDSETSSCANLKPPRSAMPMPAEPVKQARNSASGMARESFSSSKARHAPTSALCRAYDAYTVFAPSDTESFTVVEPASIPRLYGMENQNLYFISAIAPFF